MGRAAEDPEALNLQPLSEPASEKAGPKLEQKEEKAVDKVFPETGSVSSSQSTCRPFVSATQTRLDGTKVSDREIDEAFRQRRKRKLQINPQADPAAQKRQTTLLELWKPASGAAGTSSGRSKDLF